MKCLTGRLHLLNPQVAQQPVERLLVDVVLLRLADDRRPALCSWPRPTEARPCIQHGTKSQKIGHSG